jgi:hypothetical protein
VKDVIRRGAIDVTILLDHFSTTETFVVTCVSKPGQEIPRMIFYYILHWKNLK